MSEYRVPLRVVFYYQEDNWIARCLEFDLIGTGESQSEALQMLGEAIELQVQASIKSNNPENLFSPADGVFLSMWSRGRHVAIGELQIRVEPVEIEGIDAREFSDGGLAMA